MSLFVANISKNVRRGEIEDLFEEFGKCTIRPNKSYAFVDYDDDKSAEDAQKKLDGKNMGGLKIAIEWSKKSRHYDERQAAQRPHARENRRDERCYNCDRTGHYARDCRQQRRKDDGGRREGGKGRVNSRSRSFTPPKDRRRGRDDSRSRSPARDRGDRGDRRRRSPPRRREDRREDRRDRSPRRDKYRRSPERRSPHSNSRSRSPRALPRGDEEFQRQSDRRTNSPRRVEASREKRHDDEQMREDPEAQQKQQQQPYADEKRHDVEQPGAVNAQQEFTAQNEHMPQAQPLSQPAHQEPQAAAPQNEEHQKVQHQD